MPIGASVSGLLSLITAAWGGLSVFWGPEFGYRPTATNAWEWTTQNWLLHAIPGAVGLAAALMIIGIRPARRVGSWAKISLPALLLIAAGAWFVIGPAAWPVIESGSAFGAAGVHRELLFQVGANLGPGLLLAVFGGMALKAGIARPSVTVEPVDTAPAAPVGPPAGAAVQVGDVG